MIWNILYTAKARDDLLKMGKDDARRVVSKIKFYAEQENPIRNAKKLEPPFANLYRFRVGEYRVIFEIEKHGKARVLFILHIKHRREAYE
jgi:mRNA interferase RelE/StbE